MKFPYVRERGRFLPIITIPLEGTEGWVTFDAFVDSGASYSIFRAEVGDILGLDVEKGEKRYITVGDGSLMIVYMFMLNIQIRDDVSEASVGFSKQPGIGFNILGRKDVFERFRVCFDEKDRIVEFI